MIVVLLFTLNIQIYTLWHRVVTCDTATVEFLSDWINYDGSSPTVQGRCIIVVAILYSAVPGTIVPKKMIANFVNQIVFPNRLQIIRSTVVLVLFLLAA